MRDYLQFIEQTIIHAVATRVALGSHTLSTGIYNGSSIRENIENNTRQRNSNDVVIIIILLYRLNDVVRGHSSRFRLTYVDDA